MEDREQTHRRIAAKMDRLHRQSTYVAIGFILFWIAYGLAWIGVGVVYWPF